MNLKSASTLILGVLLIAGGVLFLLANLSLIQIAWWDSLKMVLPTLMVLYGGLKLGRHFSWSEEQLTQHPARAGLLSGLFWLGLGSLIALDVLKRIELLPVLGLYWPLLIIVFGILKVVDYFRFHGRVRVRFAEIVGVVFVCCFGLATAKLADAHLSWYNDQPWNLSWPPFFEGAEPKHLFESQTPFDLEGVQQVEIRNHYGDVAVEPGETAQAICDLDAVIRAEVRKEAESLFSRLQVTGRRDQGTLIVELNRAELGNIGRKLTSDLVLKIPRNLPVSVQNEFGDVSVITREAPVTVNNTYGEVQVEAITGDTVITNQFKEVTARRLQGDLTVTNRRAPVEVSEVTGNLTVTTDHDSVECYGVQGAVTVAAPFGRIEVEKIGGPVRLDGEASRISASDLGDSLWLRNSHKEVELDNIRGRIEVETSYGSLRLARAENAVEITSAHGDVSCEGLQQGLVLKGKSSKVELTRVQGAVEVETSLRDIRVVECAGPLDLQNEFAQVNVELGVPVRSAVSISNRSGEINLSVPETANFNLSAQAQEGEIFSDFGPQPEGNEEGMTFLRTSIGKGGPEIKLQTSQSRIQIRKRG